MYSNTKSIFASKTFWANIIALIATLLGVFGVDLSPSDQLALVTAVSAVLPVVNIILRAITSRPVSLSGD